MEKLLTLALACLTAVADIAHGAPSASFALSERQMNLMQAASRAALARRSDDRERVLFAEGIIAERRV